MGNDPKNFYLDSISSCSCRLLIRQAHLILEIFLVRFLDGSPPIESFWITKRWDLHVQLQRKKKERKIENGDYFSLANCLIRHL